MSTEVAQANLLRVSGTVQGVGFRPFVFELAHAHDLRGWVRNGGDGVEIHIEGAPTALTRFTSALHTAAPPAAAIVAVQVLPTGACGFTAFEIIDSEGSAPPRTRISADLPLCDACRAELEDLSSRRFGYAYISCAHCGPRYSIVTALPYDRAATTMAEWSLCGPCAAEYKNAADRRFHAQPTACPDCGPAYTLIGDDVEAARGIDAIRAAAGALCVGRVLAVKGIGGYHLVCDARNEQAVGLLRARKYRKEKPFAIMTRDLAAAHELVALSADAEALLRSTARPIVLAPARCELPLVAPDSRHLGVMLPYAPIHHLLFGCGAPALLVVTSANRSSEPIAFEDADALERLAGIADAFLVGERPIARRVEDSVARVGSLGPQLLRRSRGYAPAAAARVPLPFPALGMGADLKNTIALAVAGDAFVSQHIGDLDYASARLAFHDTITDLLTMYEIDPEELVITHDLHPEYASTQYAAVLPARAHHAVQHHRAHVASVLAERGAFDTRVLGVAFDGAGYGDDGSVWGGEFFVGSIIEGLDRVAHLRPALLPGGDAAARHPVQAAAGFLAELDDLPDLSAPPFHFPARYQQARRLLESGTRVFATTSAGRLFDTVAALLGFTREVSYEGQAAMWLEHIAGRGMPTVGTAPTFANGALDVRPTLQAIIDARRAGTAPAAIARDFHYSLARGVAHAILTLCELHDVHVVALSGGVFQNDLLLHDLKSVLADARLDLWVNQVVPPNDGGISLGQVAMLTT